MHLVVFGKSVFVENVCLDILLGVRYCNLCFFWLHKKIKPDIDDELVKHKCNVRMTIVRGSRIVSSENLKDKITCTWIGCEKKQKNEDIKFKVCGGCKMAYYCSKSCQKRAWNSKHRNICHKLRQYYALWTIFKFT